MTILLENQRRISNATVLKYTLIKCTYIRSIDRLSPFLHQRVWQIDHYSRFR